MISVIIPAYNAAKYLERAVANIVADTKTASQFEILIIENGSTDNTTQIAEDLNKKYDNIYLYHSEKGVSNARNLGIEKAIGDWVVFVDADDYITNAGIKELTELMQSSTEIADMYAFGHEAGKMPHSVTDKEQIYTDIEKCRSMMIANPTRYMQAWAKLFSKKIIDKYSLRFDTTMSLSEDSDFTLRYSRYCKKIVLSPVIAYHYSIDNNSTMRGTSSGDKVKRFITAMEKTSLSVQEESNIIQSAFNKYVLMNLNIAMVRDVYSVTTSLTAKERKIKLKQTAQTPIFEKAIKQTKLKECLTPRMIPVLCMKAGFYQGAGMVYRLRAKQNAKREQ